jgi:hypothetical protein
VFSCQSVLRWLFCHGCHPLGTLMGSYCSALSWLD